MGKEAASMMTPEEQAYVRKLEETIVKLEARIAELERRLNMNSSNSSKPPSTDKPNQKKRSLRKPSGKSPAVKADIRELP
jgi:transposase